MGSNGFPGIPLGVVTAAAGEAFPALVSTGRGALNLALRTTCAFASVAGGCGFVTAAVPLFSAVILGAGTAARWNAAFVISFAASAAVVAAALLLGVVLLLFDAWRDLVAAGVLSLWEAIAKRP